MNEPTKIKHINIRIKDKKESTKIIIDNLVYKDLYTLWIKNGNSGTFEQFLSLFTPDDQEEDFLSLYNIAKI